MAIVHDSSGDSYQALIAEESMLLRNPLTGVSQKVIAGQVVPLDLVGEYQSQVKPKSKPKSKKSDSDKD